MNKLSPEDLHLLLDEPIYVLEKEYTEAPEVPVVVETKDDLQVNFIGENKKGILILISKEGEELLDNEDAEFLFKGLNALHLSAEDVAIAENDINNQDNIDHSKRIVFSSNTAGNYSYQIEVVNDIEQLECHSISKIRNTQELKVQFWEGLKSLLKK